MGEETIGISDEERMEAAAVVSCVMNVSVAAASPPALLGPERRRDIVTAATEREPKRPFQFVRTIVVQPRPPPLQVEVFPPRWRAPPPRHCSASHGKLASQKEEEEESSEWQPQIGPGAT